LKNLREILQSQDFALTAQLSMTAGQSASDLVSEARLLSEAVDAVQVSDSAFAHAHISSIAATALIIRENIDPVLHINCRFRNRIAVQSDVFGAQALGVSSVLLIRGSDIAKDQEAYAKKMPGITLIDSIHTAAAIRDVEVVASRIRPEGPELYVGAAATAFRPEANWRQEKLLAKVDAGAQFMQLQVCMNAEVVKEFAAKLVASKLTWRVQLLAGVVVFPSAEVAREMKKSQPLWVIPQSVIDRLENADDPKQEGVDICAEVLAELASTAGISGADVKTMGAAESVCAAIEKFRALQ
jgi:methylenetetrahydrofolate reductase (NADPH)